MRCVKNGAVRGKQRFLCRDCDKTFGYTSKSAIANTKLPKEKWNLYIKCMISGYSIRKCAEIIEVSVRPSFFMRHKILDAINVHMDRGNISGIVEMDETFLAESFKGNHKKSGFEMPRKSRKSGKQVSKRGISNEQICIGTAIDKNSNIIMEMTCKGRITSKKLERLYNEHISEGTTICTDSYSSYKTLSKKLKLKHKQIPTGKHSDGIFNLSSINSLHSRFKTWMRRFNGVWDVICPIFKFSASVRKVLYTTNAIESLNSQYRRINSDRSVFPSEESLKKALFLSTQLITKKWTTKIRNWARFMANSRFCTMEESEKQANFKKPPNPTDSAVFWSSLKTFIYFHGSCSDYRKLFILP